MVDRSLIQYSVIARGPDVLAEFHAKGLRGNYNMIVSRLLPTVNNKVGPTSYRMEEYVFHFEAHDGITYLAMVDDGYSGSRAFQFLKDLRTEFIATFGVQRIRTAVALSLNSDMGGIFGKLVYRYNQEADGVLREVKEKASQVKEVMVESIDKVIARGESIELLVDKSDELMESSMSFKHESKKLRRKFCCENMKTTLLCTVFLLVVVYVIMALSCGGFDLKPHCA